MLQILFSRSYTFGDCSPLLTRQSHRITKVMTHLEFMIHPNSQALPGNAVASPVIRYSMCVYLFFSSLSATQYLSFLYSTQYICLSFCYLQPSSPVYEDPFQVQSYPPVPASFFSFVNLTSKLSRSLIEVLRTLVWNPT